VSRWALKRLLLLGLCALLALLFAGLGVWQVERLQWKLDLIARIDARLAAVPTPAPGRAEWDRLAARDAEYRRVFAVGRFDHGRETLVDALTERGPGFWVVTPLRTETSTILVNRGFIPPGRKSPERRSAGQASGTVRITGLLRLTEPGGRILRPNQVAADRWYSRDVAAIAGKRGVRDALPYFIDADATDNPGGLPLGGLTVVHFRNAHLVYALTWFGLAALSLFGLALVWKTAHKQG